MSGASVCNPSTSEELAEVLRNPGPYDIGGYGSKQQFRVVSSSGSGRARIDTRLLQGIVELHPSDQVVVVRAGTSLGDLQGELRAFGQTIPMADLPCLDELAQQSIGGLIGMNLPHPLEGQCGTWRDWVLGMTVVLADGSIARCGSQAVKNVAGYDVQKLFIGARGSLGVIAQVILRTYPIGALPVSRLELGPAAQGTATWIQRTLPTDFAACLAAARQRMVAADFASSTLWAALSPEETLPRYPSDWILRAGAGARNLELADPTQIALMKRTKQIFDPTNKLNPGEMGIF